MTPEEIWRRKSDEDLQAAARSLEEFTEARERSIEEASAGAQTAARSTQPEGTSWLVQRAMLALALMVGFYLFALLIVIALLSIPYAESMVLNRVDFRIAGACIGAALAVLWALVPRKDRFNPPGPRLDDSTSPRLFQVIREVAAATRQIEPSDVYLLGEVNAWVAQRGGTMGFGSRRVMGIGLPLLQALSVSEFKAIIAHEFGHYSSGDVKLGPWIYKTRAAIGRTIAGVQGTFVEAPFQWYGRRFLKLTHAVSRQQEFIADRVAARVTSPADCASALRRVTALTPAYSTYLNEEVVPVLQAGFLPPVAEGFDQFLRSAQVADSTTRFADAVESDGRTNEFDTHPALRDRLAALDARGDSRPPVTPGEPASALIADVGAYARALLEFAFGQDAVRRLKAIDWSLVGESVFASRWRALAKSQSKWLGRHRADTIPSGTRAFIRLGSSLVQGGELDVSTDERVARATYVLAVGIGTLLLDRGWTAHTNPGMPVWFVRGSEMFEPISAVRALAEGMTTTEAWKSQCEALGITGVCLGAPSSNAPAVITRLPAPKVIPPGPGANEIACWQCKHVLAVTDENRGKKIKCPQCGTKQELPR